MQPHLVDGEGDPEGDDPHVVEEEDHEDDIPEESLPRPVAHQAVILSDWGWMVGGSR